MDTHRHTRAHEHTHTHTQTQTYLPTYPGREIRECDSGGRAPPRRRLPSAPGQVHRPQSHFITSDISYDLTSYKSLNDSTACQRKDVCALAGCRRGSPYRSSSSLLDGRPLRRQGVYTHANTGTDTFTLHTHRHVIVIHGSTLKYIIRTHTRAFLTPRKPPVCAEYDWSGPMEGGGPWAEAHQTLCNCIRVVHAPLPPLPEAEEVRMAAAIFGAEVARSCMKTSAKLHIHASKPSFHIHS